MKFCRELLETLGYYTVKAQSLYFTYTSIGTGLWQTDRQATPRQNYDS